MRPDGLQLVTSFSEKLAHLWTVATGLEMPVMMKLPGKATALAASEDDHRLAVAVDGTIGVYDSASGNKIIPDFETELLRCRSPSLRARTGWPWPPARRWKFGR